MRGGAECLLGGPGAAVRADLVDLAEWTEAVNVPSWIWILAGVALVLLILWLVGVRFDVSVR
jgi:hypothetical protein